VRASEIKILMSAPPIAALYKFLNIFKNIFEKVFQK